MEHTNLAARIDIEAGNVIEKLSSSPIVMKMTQIREIWTLMTKTIAYIASSISLMIISKLAIL